MEVPVYPLIVILKMDDSHLPAFTEFLNITEATDVRGQIALSLDRLGKLAMVPPIASSNLATLVSISKPDIREGTEPEYPKVERYQRMLYHSALTEFAASIGIAMPMVPKTTDPTTAVDPTLEVEDRAKYFEIDETGFGIYIDDAEMDGPYESLFHNSLATDLPGQIYLIYGTIQPDLTRSKEIAKRLFRDLGWMPDIKTKGWAICLRQMAEYLYQAPMDFVGLIVIHEQEIVQINGASILYNKESEHSIMNSDANSIVTAARDNLWIEDYFGSNNEGVWFEIPTLNSVSPRISIVGIRCSQETEIIGRARYKVIELSKTLVGRLKLPKLKTNTLYM